MCYQQLMRQKSDSSTDKHKILPLMATGNDGNVPSLCELTFITASTLQARKWALRDEREGVVWAQAAGPSNLATRAVLQLQSGC